MWRLIGALLIAFSISCSGPKTTLANNPGAVTGPAGATLTVAVAPVENLPVEASVRVTGSYVAKETSDVAPETGGKVIETPVDVGDFVQQGQVIARLEDRDAKLRLGQAQANEQKAEAGLRQAQSRIGLVQGGQFDADTVPEVLSAKANADSAAAQARLAEADAQRYANLLKTGDVSQSAYDKFRTQADTAQAQAKAAQQQYEATLMRRTAELSWNRFRAGFALRHAGAGGDGAQSGRRYRDPCALRRLHQCAAHCPRPVCQRDLQDRDVAAHHAHTSRITSARSQRARYEIECGSRSHGSRLPGARFSGARDGHESRCDSSSRTITVIAEFPNTDIALKPGMFATARILLAGNSMGLFVPRAAVITDPTTNSSQLYFIRDGRARVAVVQLGATRDNTVQILLGISPAL